MLAKVAEEKISYVSLKMTAEVLFDSFPNDPVKGHIAKIDPTTDPKTRTFIAYVEISNKDLKLTPGLTGFARINYRKNSLVVPSISVINPVGENATVFVVDQDSTARIKKVKTGLTAGGLTEILEGLKEGDKVAFAGVQALKEGDRVEVIESKL
jgi:RND family efflux transporter MFP subunit